MTESADDDIEAPELVHWSPRHGPTVSGAVHLPASPLSAVGLLAVFGLAIGALAVGARATGRLAVGQAVLKDVRSGRLEGGDLVVLHRNGRSI